MGHVHRVDKEIVLLDSVTIEAKVTDRLELVRPTFAHGSRKLSAIYSLSIHSLIIVPIVFTHDSQT